MTRIVVKSDASVRGRKIGIGYHIERVGDDGEQVEMLVKDQHPLSPSDCSNHADTVREAEYIGVLRAVEAAREYVRDEEASTTRHTPTSSFWDHLVHIEDTTGRMAEHRRQAESLGVEDNLPDTSTYKHIDSHFLPKYEARVVFALSSRLFHSRVEHYNTFEKYPRMRRLFKEAYERCDEVDDAPYYLRGESL